MTVWCRMTIQTRCIYLFNTTRTRSQQIPAHRYHLSYRLRKIVDDEPQRSIPSGVEVPIAPSRLFQRPGERHRDSTLAYS